MPRFNFASKPAKQSNPDAEKSGPTQHHDKQRPETRKDSDTNTAETSTSSTPESPASDFISTEDILTPSMPMDEAIPVEFRDADDPLQAELSPAVDNPTNEPVDSIDDIPADSSENIAPVEVEQRQEEDFRNPFENLNKDEAFLSGDDIQLNKPTKNSKLPLFGLLAVVVVLLCLSVIWYINPFPSLKTELEGLFRTADPAPELPSANLPDPVDTVSTSNKLPREWNFYLQISAFKELYKAQSDANRFRKLGLHASVDGEFIPAKRSTYYKVRLGPFESVESALRKADSLKDVVPGSAFIDSIRVEDDVVDSSGSDPVIQPTIKKYSRKATRPPNEYSSNTLPNKDVQPVPTAASGYAVHVSSFKVIKTAQQETNALIVRGLPAYTTKIHHDGTTWYRVLVGPFRTQSEAKRYLEIVKKDFGNTAYVRDLSK